MVLRTGEREGRDTKDKETGSGCIQLRMNNFSKLERVVMLHLVVDPILIHFSAALF